MNPNVDGMPGATAESLTGDFKHNHHPHFHPQKVTTPNGNSLCKGIFDVRMRLIGNMLIPAPNSHPPSL